MEQGNMCISDVFFYVYSVGKETPLFVCPVVKLDCFCYQYI